MNKLALLSALCLIAPALGAQTAYEWLRPTQQMRFRQYRGEVDWGENLPESHLQLGKAYYYGRGTKQNFKKARKHFSKAAQKAEQEALLFLAIMDIQGQAAAPNPQTGFAHILHLAEADYAPAQYALALLYQQGTGTAPDNAKFITWLTRAAAAPTAVPQAQLHLAQLYREGFSPYIPTDVHKAFSLALAAAEAENADAQYLVAQMFLQGEGTAKNEAEAFRFMRLAARQNLPQAQQQLSQFYRQGIGVAKEDYGAFSWMLRAAEHGLPAAQLQTAQDYLDGLGTPPSRAQARKWALKAQENGQAGALQILQQLEAD